jgi:hypothetical protein
VPARSLGRRARTLEDAVRTVGRENVRGKRITVGTTRRLTPTHKGFRALDQVLTEIQRAHGTEQTALYSFDLNLRYRDARGKFAKPPTFENVVIPRLADVRRLRRKGETMAHAFRRLTQDTVKGAIFRSAQDAPDIVDTSERYEQISALYDAMRKRLKAGLTKKQRARIERQTAKHVAKLIASTKKARQLTFRLTVKRTEG